MKKEFDVMVSRNDLIEIGFKPTQASNMLKESKDYLVKVEGVSFYDNRQINVVPARIIEKLFHIQIVR